MSQHFTPITSLAAFDDLLVQSQEHPVVLFKHDPFCGVSIRAYYELENLPNPVVMVDVARAHAMSQDIAARTGVRHESPQVIVLKDGQAVWSASHGAIKQHAVVQAVQQAQH